MTATAVLDPGLRARRRAMLLMALGGAATVTALLCLSIGAYSVPPLSVLEAAFIGGDSRAELVIAQVRLPRILFGLLVGAALGGSGAALQVLFRNPLADPGLIGISSGAALGAVTAIVLGGALAPAVMAMLSIYAIPCAAFIGAGIATVAIVTIGNRRGKVDVALMLLAGIAINAIAQSGIGGLSFIADDQQLRNLTFWTLGSLAIAGWDALPLIAICVLGPLALIASQAGALNRFMLGEVEAAHLGLDVKKLKRRIILSVALSVGAAVSFSGAINFVGLVVPHVVRLVAGADNRIVVPGSMLCGAILTVLADLAARIVVIPAELPVGLVMGAVGGPFFLWLLLRTQWRQSI